MLLDDRVPAWAVWLSGGYSTHLGSVFGFAAGLGVNVNELLQLLVLSFPGPPQEKWVFLLISSAWSLYLQKLLCES